MRIVLYTEGPHFAGDALETGPLGGAESAFIYVGRELARRGHSVTAFCNCPSPGWFSGVEFRDVRQFANWVTGESCDLFLCSRYFDVFRRPIQTRVKALWNHDLFGSGWGAALRAVAPRVDYFYALSAFHEQHLRKLVNDETMILRAPNGVDLELAESIRREQPKQHRILYTSRPERGLPEALAIYEALADPSLEFVVCTYPLPGNEEIETECRRRMDQLAARGFRVRAESLAKRELYMTIASAKAVIYPTGCDESFCISAIEAQACGTVFLTSGGSALEETVAYERLLPGDRGGFVRGLRSLLADEATRRQFEAAGLEHVRQYSWPNIARRFVEDADAFLERGDTKLPQAAAEAPYLARNAAPRISCLTVTYDRLWLLKQAIDCYCVQTYANRELLIVTDGPDRYRDAIARHLRGLGRSDIRLEWIEGGPYTLGEMRNFSLDAMRGDAFCVWDDDDLYHPERVSRQLEHLSSAKAGASFFTDQLQFHYRERRLRWVDWTRGGVLRGRAELIPGTLMSWRDARFRYPESGADSRRGEDSALLEQLLAQGVRVEGLGGAGYLFVYTYHGKNTFPEEHHDAHVSASWSFLEKRMGPLMHALESFALPMPYTIEAQNGRRVLVVNR